MRNGGSKRYRLSGQGVSLTPSALKRASREIKFDAMKTWFHDNYEDPAESTPYESAEGGYIYIWGGPYEAEEELQSEFGGLVPDDVIEELGQKLTEICWNWTRHPQYDESDDYFFESISNKTEHYKVFCESLDDVKRFANFKGKDRDFLYRLLYVNVITALETYLSDIFISSVGKDDELLRKFIESTPEFKNEKISFSDVYQAVETAEKRARSFLLDVVWHHLHRVKPMFKNTLGIEFPKQSESLFRAVIVRHDLVHRNGKAKGGQQHEINKESVLNLVKEARCFVDDIESKLANSAVKLENEEFDFSDLDF